MTHERYHTDIFPSDGKGNPLRPLDLVIIEEIPEHYWSDAGSETLREYGGNYGLITYQQNVHGGYEPFSGSSKDTPSWTNADRSLVYLISRRFDPTMRAILSYDFWIPVENLTWIPFNSLIMNVFAEYPWQIREVSGPSDEFFIKDGIPEYGYLRRVCQTPYNQLKAAHDAAMNAISSS